MTRSGKKGKNRNDREQQNPTVTEVTRIRIAKVLGEFRMGTAEVYTFEAGLTNPERAVVHELCRKMGMVSKSSGRGKQRCVTVYKSKKKKGNGMNGEEILTCLTFSEESKIVLQDLFTRYPPDDGENKELENHTARTGIIQGKSDDSFCKPSMGKVEITKKLEALASRINKDANLRQITEDRFKLPIASFRDAITSSVDSQQVVLISGETGCGKTTQVPQFLLDHMWRKGEACKIVCTQPRRISATSVAERISSERGEKVGETVGYKDEIHERDRFSDFILAILRDMLPLYPHLHLILMSATLDAERFSQYFGGCPVIRVPGFTYPVKIFYLEDVLSILKSSDDNHLDSALLADTVEDDELTEDCRVSMDEAIDLAWSSDEFEPLLELISSNTTPRIFNYQHSLTGASPLMVFAGKGRVGVVCMLLSFGADCHLRAKDGTNALEWAQRENQGEVADTIKQHMENALSKSEEEQQLLDKYLATVNPEHIDTVLIEKLLKKICNDSKEGAILVFLPGWDDINKARERLLASSFFKDSSKFVIISLHSMVPSVEQKKVFRAPPPGSRKIILSTNIAETAVTIEDVVYVIDSGRMKEKSYDPYNNVSTLQSSWISKASAKQREGRAGRCQPGICYHLYSKTRSMSLPNFQVPEIKRMPIEELCLQVKLLDPNCKIVDFLQKTLDPPVSESIRNAIIVLQDIGALSQNEDLTELGEKLGLLPVHPSTSKMLFFSILMNCLDPALTLACASDYRDPFILPMVPDERKKAAAAKSELASLYGGYSDQLIVIAAFECWQRAKYRGQEARFCSQYFVSSNTMNMLSCLRMQLQNELIRSGLIPEDVSSCSLNARDPGILHSVLVAGLYPMVGRLLPYKSGKPFVETASGAKVRLHHQSSIMKLAKTKSKTHQLVVYDEITRGDGGMHIRNCTIVGPYPLLLIATEMVVAPPKGHEEDSDEDVSAFGSDEDEMEMHIGSSEQRGERIMSSPDNTVSVVVDRWLEFESTALDVAQIYCLRERLSAAILFKVKHPCEVLPPALGASIYAIACILSYDGLSGISLPLESVDSLTSMVNAAGINNSAAGEDSKSALSGGRRVVGQNISNSNNYLRQLMNDDIGYDVRHNSPSRYHKSRKPVSNGGHLSGSSAQIRSPSLPFVPIHGSQRPPQVQGLSGHGSGRQGSSGPRSGSYKRHRGSGTR
ncbi:PREDICTED: DExH-box ATP-dependent RNA helicase DExH6-like isoform X2 [Nelumbo nucifera]|uniref:DExH-box ATP-dependent RNA helicase DExH6-like isoform X2 n=1 Tax=Nelumbo nucifera TaxID=4432 RepID=A0A1U7YSQ2_NELNU|nr:PREDICTED: DExH-box ATP-dependent RNA helicase DExH6-like isoform X2 [Nelumbo nucifera]